MKPFCLFRRVLWCTCSGSGLQNPGLQGMCRGGGTVPELTGGRVTRPHRSSPRFPPLPLRKWARPRPPALPPCLRSALPSLAVGLLPSARPLVARPLLGFFPSRAKGTRPARELPVAHLSSARAAGRLPAGRHPAPRPDRSGLRPQGRLPHSVSGPGPLQSEPNVPPQHHRRLTSTSPHLFLFFHLLFYFIFRLPSSLFPALRTSWVFHIAPQELKRFSQGCLGLGDGDRSFLRLSSNKRTRYSGPPM